MYRIGLIIVTVILLALYIATLTGLINAPDIVKNLTPIVFLFLGYALADIGFEKAISSLKEEIGRLSQKTDAAQQSKEYAQQERECLEEKIRNARMILASQNASSSRSRDDQVLRSERIGPLETAIDTARRILES